MKDAQDYPPSPLSSSSSGYPLTHQILTAELPYHEDPLTLYYGLTEDKENTLLFESSDIDHEMALQSLMIVDASLRISQKDDQVTLQALSPNGEEILTLLTKSPLKTYLNEGERDEPTLTFTFPHLQFSSAQFSLAQSSPAGPSLARASTTSSSIVHSPMDLLRFIQTLTKPEDMNDYSFFMAGVLGYDLVGFYHGITIPEKNRYEDLVFYLAESMVVVNHLEKRTTLQVNSYGDNKENQHRLKERFLTLQALANKTHTLPNEPKRATPTVKESNAEQFLSAVSQLKERIEAGEFAQIVPSRTFKIPCQSPLHAYARLKKSHPSPYLFYFHDKSFTLFGASPERALKFEKATRLLELYPIAGTKPRGRVGGQKEGEIDPTLDKAIEDELKNDPKEVSEHLMLVELAKADLTPISTPNSVIVKELMKIDRYAYVMHLVSRVQSTLKEGLDALDAYLATMNMGTLTGSPKPHAMETIYQIETESRGPYGGGIGYLTSFGEFDSCIVIRSAVVRAGVATVQAGAGIVKDSVPQTELEETRNKANSVIRAVVGNQ